MVDSDGYKNAASEKNCGFMTRRYLKLAVPSIVNNLFNEFTFQMNIFFIGRMGSPTLMAGVGLASVTVNMLMTSVVIGVNGALGTLVSQAFGMNKLKLCGLYLNRGFMIFTICCMPFATLLLFSEKILIAIGQDPSTAAVSQYYIYWLIPCTFFRGCVNLLKQFLNCCNLSYIPMISTIISNVLHLGWLCLFMIVFDMGISGIGLATLITFTTQASAMLIYANMVPELKEALYLAPSQDLFSGWGQYLAYSLPNVAMVCAEWWAFELITLMAGWVGVVEQAVCVVLFN
jgi:MATE family multidrug resistance protein